MSVRVPKPVLIVVAVVLVGLLGWGGWIWTHPTLLSDRVGGSYEYETKPVSEAAASSTIAVPEVDADEETLTFSSASARFSNNTARATASFSICIPRQDSNLVLGTGSGDVLATYCTEVRPIRDGTTMRWGDALRPNPSYIILTITPHQPGEAVVDQVSFTYSRSWKHFKQHGTSHTPTRIVVRAK